MLPWVPDRASPTGRQVLCHFSEGTWGYAFSTLGNVVCKGHPVDWLSGGVVCSLRHGSPPPQAGNRTALPPQTLPAAAPLCPSPTEPTATALLPTPRPVSTVAYLGLSALSPRLPAASKCARQWLVPLGCWALPSLRALSAPSLSVSPPFSAGPVARAGGQVTDSFLQRADR